MSPVRLVILAVLLYIGYRMLRGLGSSGSSQVEEGKKGGSGREATVQDVLVEDPVCHTLIPRHQAIRLRQQGKTWYFCSEACCDRFLERDTSPGDDA
ncbi:YHS domain-containing protein [Desulfolithobacter sp.]